MEVCVYQGSAPKKTLTKFCKKKSADEVDSFLPQQADKPNSV
jgi:hypothetical protein